MNPAAALLLFFLSPAQAGHTGDLVMTPACVDQFKGLPEIADRLGVKAGDTQNGVMLVLCDGRRYDLIALVNALLDRMDKAAR